MEKPLPLFPAAGNDVQPRCDARGCFPAVEAVDTDEPGVAGFAGGNGLDTVPTDIESPAGVVYRRGAGDALIC